MLFEKLPSKTVAIVGGGPVGLVLATTLAKHGVRSVIVERNLTTTKWPKMDLTIARSMEIYRRMGIADRLQQIAVPSHYPFTCLFSSSLHADKTITAWNLPSPDAYRARARDCNDGTAPSEPWLRVSQEIFEAWIKQLGEENPLIDFRAGWKVASAEETDDGAQITAVHHETGEEKAIQADYVVGCDGANSVLRNSLGISLDGGPIHGYAVLVHFRSKDLSRIQKHGQFWHLFFPNPSAEGGSIKGAVIAQDEIDTWTVHRFMRPDIDHTQIPSKDIVYDVLGGMDKPFPIQIDEVLVRSTWTPSIAVAKSYAGPKQRILIAGDACHQMVPTGGYGMNTGIADAYDLGWKLSGILQGWAGPKALSSYEQERRPVAQLATQWSQTHMGNLMKMSSSLGLAADVIQSKGDKGEQMRAAMHEYLQTHDGHNQSIGVEMGYCYNSGICVPSALDEGNHPPEFNPRRYQPTTMPGYRAPHVFLANGKGASIFDSFGDKFTLVVFSDAAELESSVKCFQEVARRRAFPLHIVDFPGEDHARKIWGACLVLVRPDEFVSWHGNEVSSPEEAEKILAIASGFEDID